MNAPLPAPFASLSPAPVWAHFALLCRTPRPSKHEGPLREQLQAWAQARGLDTHVDAAGNLIVRKPASSGREHEPVTALQGHLDMVCQKNTGSAHDFSRDPIQPVLGADGWLRATDTTLGADNGLGVALILAMLEDPTLSHGPLEALFTVDEEAGMGGAHGLEPGLLKAQRMINLDTEAWGEFYLGCAGGIDVDVRRPGCAEAAPAGHTGRRIALRGLRGGHSGVDIHEERGNAIQLLVRVLHDLAPRAGLRLAALQGGTARNALPREAFAHVSLSPEAAAALPQALALWQGLLRHELAGVDEGLSLSCDDAPVDEVLPTDEQAVWLDSLLASPHGVHRMSRRVPGVVETSNNLGIIDLNPAGGHVNFMVRSLLDSGTQALARQIRSLWALSGSTVTLSGAYPGWTPDPASPLLALCQRVFQRTFGEASSVQVIHAGLECGLIGGKYPGLDIVSFGPTIQGAHAPGEGVDVASVDRTWRLLCAVLAEPA